MELFGEMDSSAGVAVHTHTRGNKCLDGASDCGRTKQKNAPTPKHTTNTALSISKEEADK